LTFAFRYRQFLEDKKKASEAADAARKRKAQDEEKEERRKRRKTLGEVIAKLEVDVDKHMDLAEVSKGTKVLLEVTKANSLRKTIKEKKKELEDLASDGEQ
jgi:hypothetical protein